jgi:16S rRNA (cytosine967-C5)-methyltransferase
MKGLCYAQDPSTEIAPRLLHPRPGEAVLDACAAPGGKTALMAELMSNQGQIMASDASSARLKRMAGNLDRLHVDNVRAALHDWTRPAPDWLKQQKFDAILLDVPCSNTGVMRRRVDVRWRLDAAAFTAQAASQLALLKSVLRVLKPGGRLVYSTCSIDPEENTGVVDKLLQAHPDVKRLDERQTMPQKDGIDGAYAVLLRRG